MTMDGRGVPQDFAKALEHFEIAAEAGNVDAQMMAGTIHHEGAGEVPKNLVRAFRWFSRAAEQGNPRAEFIVGWAYEMGDGTEMSAEKMLHWYHKAATNDVSEAKTRLGIIYAYGKGITWNFAEGHYWLSAAIRENQKGARKHLADLERRIGPENLPAIRARTEARLRRNPAPAKTAQKESS